MSLVRCSLAFALCLLPGCARKTAPEAVWVGQLVPLSGPDKAVGERAEQGARLAVEEVNRADPQTPGRTFGVLHVDTRGEAETAAAEAVRLLRINKTVALLGGTDPAQADRLAKTARAYDKPALLSSSPAGQPPGDAVFCVGLAPAARGRALARLAAEKLKVSRVTVLTDGRLDTRADVAAAFGREFTRGTNARVEQRGYQDEKEFPELAARLRKEREPPQAVLLVGNARDFAKLRGRLETEGFDAPLLFGGEEASATTLQADPEAGRGVYWVTAYFPAEAGSAGQAFARTFQERYQAAPDVHAILAYESARLLFDALRAVDLPEAVKVREFLEGLSAFEGLTGPLSFGKDHYARRAAFVVRWEDRRPVLMLRVEPE